MFLQSVIRYFTPDEDMRLILISLLDICTHPVCCTLCISGRMAVSLALRWLTQEEQLWLQVSGWGGSRGLARFGLCGLSQRERNRSSTLMTVDIMILLCLSTGHASTHRWMGKKSYEHGKAASWTSTCIASCRQTQKGSFYHASITGACSFSRASMDVKFMQLHPSFKLIISLQALQL